MTRSKGRKNILATGTGDLEMGDRAVGAEKLLVSLCLTECLTPKYLHDGEVGKWMMSG